MDELNQRSEHPFWGQRCVHLLLDPDKWNVADLRAALMVVPGIVKSLIVGGTFIHSDNFQRVMDCCIESGLPVGNVISVGLPDTMIREDASYVLVPVLLNSISTEYVTHHLIRSVPTIAKHNLRLVTYAYLMLAGGVSTSAEFFTQTLPIPRGKPEILATLARAASYLGLEGIYLEAGSGANMQVSAEEVRVVRGACSLPIIAGGGVDSASACRDLFDVGVSCIVIGTAVERLKDFSWLKDV